MFAPEDPLAPPSGHFAEPWQATVLAMATTMIRAGHFSQSDWAQALGASLRQSEAEGREDTDETYFLAALSALETLSDRSGLSAQDRATRKTEWEEAYRQTPHGKPVTLR